MIRRRPWIFFTIAGSLVISGCAHVAPEADWKSATLPQAQRPAIAVDDPARWALVSKIVGVQGVYAREVYTITIPRDDLWVSTSGNDVPTAAGLDTQIYFYKCPCGRTNVTGRLVVADYEVNDAISELQKNGAITLASFAPVLMHSTPQIMAVQFQGEGDPEELATNIRHALDYTGPARDAPQKR